MQPVPGIDIDACYQIPIFSEISRPSPNGCRMRTFHGKRVLITGAAAGIGRSLALLLARKGAHVYLLDINATQLDEVVAEARQLGVEACGRVCDLSSGDAVQSAARGVLEEWKTLDVLVNNAGVFYYGRSLEMSPEEWQRLLAINLHAPIKLTYELLPTLLESPGAHILNIASFYGFVATNRSTAYHTSKFGLLGFTEALRAEYGRDGLGVTAVCPGYVTTELASSMIEKGSDKKVPRAPAWISSTPEQVARAAVRAMSRDKRMVCVSSLARIAYIIKRISPGLLDTMYRMGRVQKLRKKREQIADAKSPQGSADAQRDTPYAA